jgi:tetratricopeptide (TPR) repeat protein
MLMIGRAQINAKLPVRPLICGFLLAIVCAGLACAPRLALDDRATANPIEILERSPRIYHIKFEPMVDSLETELMSTYMLGIPDIEPGPAPANADPDRAESDRDRARVEYLRAKRRFEGGAPGAAYRHISRTLELDPGYEPAYLLLGELLLVQYRVKEAKELFANIVTRDVTNSDALVGLARCFMLTGSIENARKALIDAIIFNRVNLDAWDNLSMLASVQDLRISNHDAPELGAVRKMRGRHYDLVVDDSLERCPSQATAWIVYASQRAVWRYEGKYKRLLGARRYQRTYEEDVDCYMALAAAWNLLSQQDTTSCDSQYLDHLSGVAEDGYLVPHVLFDYVCMQDPLAARGFTAEVIEEMRDYVNRFVIVPEG